MYSTLNTLCKADLPSGAKTLQVELCLMSDRASGNQRKDERRHGAVLSHRRVQNRRVHQLKTLNTLNPDAAQSQLLCFL